MSSVLADGVVALMLLASGVAVLLGAIGVWRLPDFFTRMHAPALASSMALWLVALASVLHFSVRAQEGVLYVWLLLAVLAVTVPITTVVLMRAALFRARRAGEAVPPPLDRPAEAAPAAAPDAPAGGGLASPEAHAAPPPAPPGPR